MTTKTNNADARINQARALLGGVLRSFICGEQRNVLSGMLLGEEAEHFADLLIDLGARVESMPVTYQQDGKGEEAIAYLHYFLGGCDWHITELDTCGAPHDQAFGLANLGGGAELGYISLPELRANGIELDLYFVPATLREIRNGKEG